MAHQDILTTLKILFMGESSVGKSSLLLRFTDDTFTTLKATITPELKVKTMTVDDNTVKLYIWDTAGQERFRAMTKSYYRGAQGVILVYDVTDKKTLDNLELWINELNTYSTRKDVVKILVGNKIDKKNAKVTREDALKFASRHAMLHIETSAKTSDGVQCVFEKMVQMIIQTPGLWEKSNQTNESININNAGNNNPNYSCYCSPTVTLPSESSWFK